MALKVVSFVLIFCNILLSEQNEVVDIFLNNPDLIELKKFLLQNESTYNSGEDLNLLKPVTYEEIVEVEKKFKHYKVNTKSGLIVRHFYLFTRDYHNGEHFEILNPNNVSSIRYSHFHTRTTYFLVHGFLGNGLEAWVLSLKDKLLSMEDCNVISVDWPAGKRWFLPTYMTAAGRVPFVGNDTSYLLNSLLEHKGMNLEQVHLIGHSLGAHVCGFAAKPLDGRIARISGLDPAGPYFHKVNSSQRLDKTDAVYVDVIHTNACNKWPYWTDCYGLNENIGHSNFSPNGGQHQPGCSLLVQELAGEFGCDHERAYLYYIESLNFSPSTTYFLARPCDDWLSFKMGNCSCGRNAQYMGFNVNLEVDGTFYLATLPYPPYALQDPECTTHRQWNILIIICYAIMGSFVSCCFFSVLVLAVESIRRACCGPSIPDEENPLVSGDEEEEEEEDDDDDEEEEEDDDYGDRVK